MTDHADTIRRTFPDCKCEQHRAANEALAALVAERQQAIDALREIARTLSCSSPLVTQNIARDALLSLGEQP